MSSGMKLGSQVNATYIRLEVRIGDEVAPIEVVTAKNGYGKLTFELVEPDNSQRAELPKAMALPIAESAVRELGKWLKTEVVE